MTFLKALFKANKILRPLLVCVGLILLGGATYSFTLSRHDLTDAALKGQPIRTAIISLLRPSFVNYAQENDGRTPLHFAAHDYSTARVLLIAGANVNVKSRRGVTPLHRASKLGQAPLVELLISYGAKVNVKDNDGATPLHYAVGSGSTGVVEVLVENGARLNSRTSRGRTALHWAVLMCEEGSTKYSDDYVKFFRIAQELFLHSADVNARAEDGKTPLHVAVSEGRTVIVTYLLEKGADPVSQDKQGRTPSDIAKTKGYSGLACLLGATTASEKR